MVSKYASQYDIPIIGLLACLKAESGLNPQAAREGVWPDRSYGLGQEIVEFAPVGDGSDTQTNINLVKAWLFIQENAIKTAAAHLAGDYQAARAAGDSSVLGGLIVYNYGHYPTPNDSYWTNYAGNIGNYNAAIAWAESV